MDEKTLSGNDASVEVAPETEVLESRKETIERNHRKAMERKRAIAEDKSKSNSASSGEKDEPDTGQPPSQALVLAEVGQLIGL